MKIHTKKRYAWGWLLSVDDEERAFEMQLDKPEFCMFQLGHKNM